MTAPLTIASGNYRATLLPASGGSIGSFAWRHPEAGWVNLMRPAPARVEAPKAQETACFPLVPFANRVRDGRFEFGGRVVQLPPGEIGRHYLHGMGWLRPWTVAEAAADRALLRLGHEPGAWPYAFETSQEFSLNTNGLSVRFWATNQALEPMPFGFGLHPYFPRTPRCQLNASVAGWWETDADVLPSRLTAVPERADPRPGLTISSVTCDNAFTGWSGEAAIAWPERRTRMTMTATAPMRVLFLYVPAGEDYFCLEPASNLTDAFNLAAAGRMDTGMIVLQPGQEISASVTFHADAIG